MGGGRSPRPCCSEVVRTLGEDGRLAPLARRHLGGVDDAGGPGAGVAPGVGPGAGPPQVQRDRLAPGGVLEAHAPRGDGHAVPLVVGHERAIARLGPAGLGATPRGPGTDGEVLLVERLDLAASLLHLGRGEGALGAALLDLGVDGLGTGHQIDHVGEVLDLGAEEVLEALVAPGLGPVLGTDLHLQHRQPRPGGGGEVVGLHDEPRVGDVRHGVARPEGQHLVHEGAEGLLVHTRVVPGERHGAGVVHPHVGQASGHLVHAELGHALLGPGLVHPPRHERGDGDPLPVDLGGHVDADAAEHAVGRQVLALVVLGRALLEGEAGEVPTAQGGVARDGVAVDLGHEAGLDVAAQHERGLQRHELVEVLGEEVQRVGAEAEIGEDVVRRRCRRGLDLVLGHGSPLLMW